MQIVHKNGSMQSCQQNEHREWIKGRVATALAHFWREDDDPRLASAMITDWLDVLEEFEQDEIQAAFLAHLRSTERKPTIAGIVCLITGIPPAEKLGTKPSPQIGDRKTFRDGKEYVYAGEPGWIREYC